MSSLPIIPLLPRAKPWAQVSLNLRANPVTGLVAVLSGCLCVLSSIFLASSFALADDEARRLVAVVDYIGGDYKNAVRGGKVINQDEYQEMREFSRRSLELLSQLKEDEKTDKAGIEPSLRALASHIENRKNEKVVAEVAERAKERLIAAYGIVPYPKRIPSLAVGKTVFVENCAQCHGQTGKGDGSGRETMNPKAPPPANFTDPEIMASLSPFKAFNTATFGLQRTAMPDFSALTEEERWQVAFYIFSLRFSPEVTQEGKKLLEIKKIPENLRTVARLSTLSDEELQEKLRPYFPLNHDAFKALAYLRRGLLEDRNNDPLLTARTFLSEATRFYEKGEKEKAYQKAVEAYLEGFELVEPALFARDAGFGRSLEARFTQFRSSIKRGDAVTEVQELYREIDSGLLQASQLLAGNDSLIGGYLFLNAALIILREGLEAALILVAIVASLRVMGATESISYIHLGWGLAVVAGLLTWILAQTVLSISGSHRESMEGLATLTASIILFYMGYWLHTKAEARKWQKFVQDKVHGALSRKRVLALVGVSFFAVYREAFEVVLFYQALWLQSSNTHDLVIWGFLAGLAALAILALAIFKLGLKIPLKYFFGATGALLYLLAFTFAGDGVKKLQAAGWFSVTPLQYSPQLPILGVYPTLETLAAQGVMLMGLLSTLIWFARQRRKPA